MTEEPDTALADSGAEPSTPLFRRLLKWAAVVVATALLGWGAVDLARRGVDSVTPDPLTLEQELLAEFREAGREGYRVIENIELDLRGTGELSRLVVLRHRSAFTFDPVLVEKSVSDEIRVYDYHGEDLDLVFRFQPSVKQPGRVATQFLFEVDQVADLDGNSLVEIVGAFYVLAMDRVAPRPVLIRYDHERNRYRIIPILNARRTRAGVLAPSTKPELARRAKPGTYAAFAVESYLTPTTFTDVHSGESFSSYSTDDFLLRQGRASPVLLTAFVVQARSHSDLPLLEIIAWSMNLEGADPFFYVCGLTRDAAHLLRRPRVFEGSRSLMSRVWQQFEPRQFC